MHKVTSFKIYSGRHACTEREALERRDRDDETLAEIGRSYNVSG